MCGPCVSVCMSECVCDVRLQLWPTRVCVWGCTFILESVYVRMCVYIPLAASSGRVKSTKPWPRHLLPLESFRIFTPATAPCGPNVRYSSAYIGEESLKEYQEEENKPGTIHVLEWQLKYRHTHMHTQEQKTHRHAHTCTQARTQQHNNAHKHNAQRTHTSSVSSGKLLTITEQPPGTPPPPPPPPPPPAPPCMGPPMR